MFAEAYEIASEFTQPVIISTRKFNGDVNCGIASFVIINDEGWFLSATHILQSLHLFEQHKTEIASYDEKRNSIENNPNFSDQQKVKRTRRLKTNSDWITHHSFWWGHDDLRATSFQGVSDLLVGKFETFNPDMVKTYPTFKNPNNLLSGTSLCKLGFPFHVAQASFDETKNMFNLAPGTLPVPRFPIEGIFTRSIFTPGKYGNGHTVKFMETSSPGLRGQSGGPIFDKNGTIWGIQSHTTSLPLGFEPTVKQGNREVVESQFLNVGVGIHPEVIVNVLNDMGIKYKLSDY